LVQRDDERWEVRCPQCGIDSAEAAPIGIGLAVANRVEAGWIVRNHTPRPVIEVASATALARAIARRMR